MTEPLTGYFSYPHSDNVLNSEIPRNADTISGPRLFPPPERPPERLRMVLTPTMLDRPARPTHAAIAKVYNRYHGRSSVGALKGKRTAGKVVEQVGALLEREGVIEHDGT